MPRTRRIALRGLAAILGTWHGLIGLVGLVLYRTGPEPTSMLVMSLALVSTPGALVLGLWGGHRLAAGWLACAAMVWAVAGNREYGEWWYALLFYGPQLVAAYLFWRRNDGGASGLSFMRSAAMSPASPARRIVWSVALVVGFAHAGLGFWLVMAVISRGLTLGWWIPCVASLASTLCATLAARRNPRSAGRWLIAAACLGAFAVGRALHLSPSSLAVNILMWWLPQVALGLLFMRTHRIEEHGMHQSPPPIARTAAH
jgi:succinate dehydrogenase hydrophobic anchor subunit